MQNINRKDRDSWVERTLSNLPSGTKVLDVGASDQKKYKEHCSHLNYVSQDFCQYNCNTPKKPNNQRSNNRCG